MHSRLSWLILDAFLLLVLVLVLLVLDGVGCTCIYTCLSWSPIWWMLWEIVLSWSRICWLPERERMELKWRWRLVWWMRWSFWTKNYLAAVRH